MNNSGYKTRRWNADIKRAFDKEGQERGKKTENDG